MKPFLIVVFSLVIVTGISQNKIDDKGRKQGNWIKYQEGVSKKAYEGNFIDDKPNGLFKFYYKEIESLQSEVFYKDNGKVAYATLYNGNGKIQAKGKYVDELKDSIWEFFDTEGLLISRENYLKGKRDGKSIVFFRNGNPSEEKLYRLDVLNGAYTEYYDDKKKKSESQYLDGNLNGKSIFYYPNGVEAASKNYKKGVPDGLWIYKEKDGKISSKEMYVEGKALSEKQMSEYLKKTQKKKEKNNTNEKTKKSAVQGNTKSSKKQ